MRLRLRGWDTRQPSDAPAVSGATDGRGACTTSVATAARRTRAAVISNLEKLDDARLCVLARLCGTALARAHARSADSKRGTLGKISGYVGCSADDCADFCDAVVSFAQTYADVTAHDRAVLASAIREEKQHDGR